MIFILRIDTVISRLNIRSSNIIFLEKEEILRLFETANKDYIFLTGNYDASIKFFIWHLDRSAIINYKGKNTVWVNIFKENNLLYKKANKKQ